MDSDLQHWRSVAEVTLRQATLLVAGADPHSASGISAIALSRARTLEMTIAQELTRALQFANEFFMDPETEKGPCIVDIWEAYGDRPYLVCLELRNAVGDALQADGATASAPLAMSPRAWINGSDFDRWLEAMEIYSAYRFPGHQGIVLRETSNATSQLVQGDQQAATAPLLTLPPSRWPWGTHRTKLLEDLAAAAHEWWGTFDSENPTTAPKNEDVSDWLVKERNVTRRMANAIATILRADGLRTGPRVL